MNSSPTKSTIQPSPANRFERRKQRTRDQLKAAVMALILEKGYEEVSIQDITDRADLGRGTFYVHFQDKEDLVWSTLNEEFNQLFEEINTRHLGEKSPRYEFLVWLTMFEYAGDHADLFRILVGSQGSARLQQRIEDYLAELMLQGIEAGECFPQFQTPPLVLARTLTGGVVSAIMWWLEHPDSYTAYQMASHIFTLIFRQPPPISADSPLLRRD
ncbi:MAG: TetR/AcrR family transcriptional regulator [Anaerolineae bacterium]|nr:TetR/AcrR family transcriptional regulator [Anaerolineae bacterium]